MPRLIQCEIETIERIKFSEKKIDLSKYSFYLSSITLSLDGHGSLHLSDDIWDGELSWNWNREDGYIEISAEGTIMIGLSEEDIDLYAGMKSAHISIDVVFRKSGDSDPVSRKKYDVVKNGTFMIRDLKAVEEP